MQVERAFFGDRTDRRVAAILAALLLAAFAPTLVWMVVEWANRPEASHGFLMPPLAAYLIYTRRDRLKALQADRSASHARWSLFGAVLAVPAVAGLLAGEMQLSQYLRPYAFVGLLTIGLAMVYGIRSLRLLAAPLIVVFLMCPIPGRVERDLTLPLKKSASILATGLMHLTGLPVLLEGNMIRLPGIDRMWIADACSGIRSLISLVSVAIVACFFWRRHWTLKAVLVASTVPIAVVVNSLRIWLTGFLSVHVSQKAAQGFFHVCEGFLLFAVAAAILWAWALLLGWLFPRREAEKGREEGREAEPPGAAAGRVALRFPQLFLIALLAASTAAVYLVRHRIGSQDADPVLLQRTQDSLRALPLEIDGGRYVGESHPIDPDIVERSGADCYASYLYRDKERRLYQVYVGSSVKNTENFHAPNYCMPAAGWETLDDDAVPFAAFPTEEGTEQRRLSLQKGDERMIVYFWLQAGERIAHSEFAIRFLRLWDLVLGRPLRPAVIVTLYVPVLGSPEETEKAALDFQKAIGGALRSALAAGE